MDNLSEEEFQKHVKELFYRTSYQNVGERAHEARYDTPHGINGAFTNHLLASGMWRNNGLNTQVDSERHLDGCKDWMDKIN